jgi:hypothetical protein
MGMRACCANKSRKLELQGQRNPQMSSLDPKALDGQIYADEGRDYRGISLRRGGMPFPICVHLPFGPEAHDPKGVICGFFFDLIHFD